MPQKSRAAALSASVLAASSFFLVEKRDRAVAAFISSRLPGARLPRYRRIADGGARAPMDAATQVPALD